MLSSRLLEFRPLFVVDRRSYPPAARMGYICMALGAGPSNLSVMLRHWRICTEYRL